MQARIRQSSTFTAVALTAVVLLGGTALAQSGSSEIGTWKLNVAKSKYIQGDPPKSSTTKITAAGAGVKIVTDAVSADGTVRHSESSSNYDGKDSPIVGNSQNGDVVARTRVNATTIRSVFKNGGKVTVTSISVISEDGKTRTTTATGTNALGKAVNSVQVYEKQ